MNMMRFLFTLLLSLQCFAASAQRSEQATIYIQVMPYQCPAPMPINAQVLFLENYVDGLLPNDVFITTTMLWAETDIYPIDAGHVGNFFVAVDPQQKYLKKANFPATQAWNIQFLKSLGMLETVLGGSQQRVTNFSPPVRYSKGDAIIVAPECYAAYTKPYYYYILVGIEAPYPGHDLVDLPQPTWLLNTLHSTSGVNQPPTTVTSVIPASPTPITKFRPRIAQTVSTAFSTIVSRVSVCVQSAPGSSTCAAPPVEIKFGGQSGFTLTSMMQQWGDWTDFSAPAGKNLLVRTRMFQSGNTNAWSFNGSGGPGAWTDTGDSWNSATPLGTTTYYPNITAVVDSAQSQ